MSQLLGAVARDVSPGLIRVSGSFTTNASNAVVNIRPGKGEFTVTRKAAGVYVVTSNLATLSVVNADAQIGHTSNIVGAGSVSLATAVPGYTICPADYMTTDAAGTHYAADSTNKNFLILVLNSANNALSDIYSLSNTSSKANYRVGFEFILATSGLNS